MTRLWQSREAAAAAAEKLKVYAQAQRLMILSALLEEERNVGEIAEATGIGQPTLSQQLGELRRADLVRTRKEVKQVWYALANDDVALCVRSMESIFGRVGTQMDVPRPSVPQLQKSAPAPEPVCTPEGVAAFARLL